MRKGYVFTCVCLSVHGVCVVYTPLGRHLLARHPLTSHPQADTPQGRLPGRHPPVRDDHCSGRYTPYWNAFLFCVGVWLELLHPDLEPFMLAKSGFALHPGASYDIKYEISTTYRLPESYSSCREIEDPKSNEITKRSNTMPLVAYHFVLPKKYSPLVDAFILLTSKFGLRQIPQYPTVKISTNLGKNLLKTGSVWN